MLVDFLQDLMLSRYIQDWTPFEHPQLGQVEIGGVDNKWCLQNPPPELLEAEIAKNTGSQFCVLHHCCILFFSSVQPEMR